MPRVTRRSSTNRWAIPSDLPDLSAEHWLRERASRSRLGGDGSDELLMGYQGVPGC